MNAPMWLAHRAKLHYRPQPLPLRQIGVCLSPFNTINLLLFCEDGCEGKLLQSSCLREKHIGYLTDKAVDMLNEHPTRKFLPLGV